MIKIRSTEKLATSNSQGLCDVQRILSEFTFNLKKQIVKTIVTDVFFKEQTITVDGTNITERKIIETKQGVAYNFSIEDIDNFYQVIGSSITKTEGFSTGLTENLISVLIAQTVTAERQTMKIWIPDTEYVLVSEFTKV